MNVRCERLVWVKSSERKMRTEEETADEKEVLSPAKLREGGVIGYLNAGHTTVGRGTLSYLKEG
jgi:hypothetical protein